MKDIPDAERPRERFAKEGASGVKNEDLVAIMLRTGTKGRNVLDIAREIISKYESLADLSRISLEELQKIKGVGRDKAVTLKAAFTLAQKMADEIAKKKPVMETPDRVADLLRDECVTYEVEQFQVLLLNTRRRLIKTEKLASGTLDTILVHPREVFKMAIACDAAALILVHNHPSGDPTPSEADIKVTRDLIRAGQLLKIEVLDHVIIGRRSQERERDYVSLRELGYFYT